MFQRFFIMGEKLICDWVLLFSGGQVQLEQATLLFYNKTTCTWKASETTCSWKSLSVLITISKLHLILVWLIVPALSPELPQAFPLSNHDPVVPSPISSSDPGFFFFFSKALSRIIFCISLFSIGNHHLVFATAKKLGRVIFAKTCGTVSRDRKETGQ